jgi:hypothetical protein
VTWEEVERVHKKKDASLLVFEAQQVIERFEKMGDLHAPVLELKQKLPDMRGAAVARPATVDLAAQADEEPTRETKRVAAKPRENRAAVAARKPAGKKSAKPAAKKRRAV